MPLTASKTDADTSATTRLLTSGLVPPARTVVFMMPIHSRTGSGVAADTARGPAASSATISVSNTLHFGAPKPRRRSNRNRPELNPVKLRIIHLLLEDGGSVVAG